jgi:hypothetical protein
MKASSKAMPQNHRPGSTFGNPNKPSADGAPLPMNQGYKRVFQSGKKGNKFAAGGKKPPGTC